MCMKSKCPTHRSCMRHQDRSGAGMYGAPSKMEPSAASAIDAPKPVTADALAVRRWLSTNLPELSWRYRYTMPDDRPCSGTGFTETPLNAVLHTLKWRRASAKAVRMTGVQGGYILRDSCSLYCSGSTRQDQNSDALEMDRAATRSVVGATHCACRHGRRTSCADVWPKQGRNLILNLNLMRAPGQCRRRRRRRRWRCRAGR